MAQLSGWSPKTEYLLLSSGGGAYDVIDHGFEASFPLHLQAELRSNGYIGNKDENGDKKLNNNGRLIPARTAADVNLQSLLGGFLDDSANDSSTSNVRGDEATFISREERSRKDFPSNYPFLNRLISSIERTVTKDNSMFQQSFEFDKSLTSVQLARYRGDNKSGYPRHCDRGMACTKENSDEVDGKMQRLLTFVYYLTPADWDEQLDGGALRMHIPNRSDHFDVTPYAGRLVIFRSDVMEHEVMPSKRRERIAITVWLYGRVIKKDRKMVASDGKVVADRSAIKIANTILAPPLPILESVSTERREATIFVAIPSFRDAETFPTIKSLIETANSVERIHVGVVFQVDISAQEEIEQFTSGKDYVSYFEKCGWNHETNLRTIMIDYRHATGPCYARHLAQSLHRGEDYVLQIDSHMRFRPNWDVHLIHQLNQCTDPSKSVLTAYPPNYDPPHGPGPDAETRGTILVPWKFDDKDGMLRQKGRLMNPQSSNVSCLLFAGGFNFFNSSLLDMCPYDGSLHGLFFGEEISMAVRLFTHGVDLYAPPETVCYHMWKRNPLRKKQAANENEAIIWGREDSLNVIRAQLSGKGRGLGTVRTAEQFAQALGVNFETHELSKGCENVGLGEESFVSSNLGVCGIDINSGMEKSIAQTDMSKVMNLVSQFMNNV